MKLGLIGTVIGGSLLIGAAIQSHLDKTYIEHSAGLEDECKQTLITFPRRRLWTTFQKTPDQG